MQYTSIKAIYIKTTNMLIHMCLDYLTMTQHPFILVIFDELLAHDVESLTINLVILHTIWWCIKFQLVRRFVVNLTSIGYCVSSLSKNVSLIFIILVNMPNLDIKPKHLLMLKNNHDENIWLNFKKWFWEPRAFHVFLLWIFY